MSDQKAENQASNSGQLGSGGIWSIPQGEQSEPEIQQQAVSTPGRDGQRQPKNCALRRENKIIGGGPNLHAYSNKRVAQVDQTLDQSAAQEELSASNYHIRRF